MLLNGLYIFVGGYVKIRLYNLLPALCGIAGMILYGLALNWFWHLCGLDAVGGDLNAMYLQHSPHPEIPFFTGYFFFGVGLLTSTLFVSIWELVLRLRRRHAKLASCKTQ